jgi:peptidoglycan/LPS O-acetylase OafA/YrhL
MARTDRLQGLDALRGCAILMVIVFHVALHFKLSPMLARITAQGYNGVQLFFLISAVTMCHMWALRQGEPAQAARFLVRRAARIAPPFWLALVFYAVWRQWGPGTEPQADLASAALSAAFLHGLSPTAINLAVPGGWSIADEMMFYLSFPLLVGLLRTPIQRMVFALLSFVLAAVVATWLRQENGPGWEQFLYFSMLTQFPIFPLGMLVYSLRLRGDTVPLWLGMALLVAWFAVAVWGRQMGGLTRPHLWAEVFVLAGVVALGLGRLKSSWLAFAGRISYSGYLFHFAVIDVVIRAVPQSWQRGDLGFAVALLTTLALTGLLAWLSARTLEAWTTRVGHRLASRIGDQPNYFRG